MILEKGSFSIFPANMCKGLPAYEQIVFIWLCHHSNSEGQCFPSLNTLSAECGVSKDTITRSIKKLEDRGYITKIIRTNEKGENISNLYTIVLSNANSGHLAADNAYPLAADGGHLAADVDTNYTNITKPNSELKENITTLCDSPSHDTDYFVINQQKIKKPDFSQYPEDFPFGDYEPIENMDLSQFKANRKVLENVACIVLHHFNWVVKSRFRPVNANLRFIVNLLSSGIRIKDFYVVHSMKYNEWGKDIEYSKYLRPKTIYAATNFENYLGEVLKRRAQRDCKV